MIVDLLIWWFAATLLGRARGGKIKRTRRDTEGH
jgi:hypothetical protein